MIDLRRSRSVSIDAVNNRVAVQHETNVRAPDWIDSLQCQKHCHRFEDIYVKRLEFERPLPLHRLGRGMAAPPH